MSRTGKKPVVLPEKVKARVGDGVLSIEGPLGNNKLALNRFVKVEADGKQITVARIDDSREAKEAHGMFRALVSNVVSGVSKGFQKKLEIQGVGYRADAKGNVLNLTLGFSHPVEFPIPSGIKIAVEKQTKLTISGNDKELVGQIAADIRGLKPPEPYKGKGIRYEGEIVHRKVGKAAAGVTGGAPGGK